ncbi:protein-methionine-sulfoxide reductase heme-binding subunit MsrQ [Chitinasiproducens palmae]|uniref:Protein-methionine-sulfoxide reductase heme-binding subunit MsrQ n=1 Tax=Chitinasiproducens palmae TaxID=1770053 RepID=A0A1H2PXH6_9BURK|nr:protein-methionine-sulfoxide reductase heme-binding subunit MsrQ [Chitinasiproducens palmae]SDV51333.1 sulfoxide reductase heme-binding subunit YedZ [Chitinasiproducens palmae]
MKSGIPSNQRSAAPAGATVNAALLRRMAVIKPVVFLLCLYPLLRLVWFGVNGGLGANPVEFVTRSTGLWALVFLCITLAVTPARRLTGWSAWLRLRRMLGLFSFFYAALHFLTYVWLDQFFDVAAIARDIAQRPFILVGFAAFVLLVILATTSPKAAVRRLGRRWQLLHRTIYAAAGLAILHFWWMKAGKHDLAQPQLYAVIVIVLLLARLLWLAIERTRREASPR